MALLYLTHQGARVRRAGDALLVEHRDAPAAKVEVHRLEAVFVFGRVHLTLPVLERLLRRRIAVAFFTRRGRLKGRLVPPAAAQVSRRLAQYARWADPAARLAMGRALVLAKLQGAAWTLRRFASNHPGAAPAAATRDLAGLARAVTAADSLQRLRGLEGLGARTYFAQLARMNLSALAFRGRSARPPADPLNALLSLTYVLLGAELAALLEGLGLDPYVGFYHDPADGRPSLALDLLEAVRHPLADRFCLAQANHGVFGTGDFDQVRTSSGRPGVYLRKDRMPKYLARYDRWMRTPRRPGTPAPRDALRRLAEDLLDALRTGAAFQPFRRPEATP